jgi:hypothetical protein
MRIGARARLGNRFVPKGTAQTASKFKVQRANPAPGP